MKKQIITTLILILLLIPVGCSNDEHSDAKATYVSEASDLINFMKNDPYENNPNNYSLINTSKLLIEEDAVRLEYEIFIQDPKVIMKEVIMSFHLADDMMNYLNANNVFHTNTDYDNSFDITPAGEVEGASLSRAFVLEPTKIDDKILSIYETIYIKISYTV